MCSYIAVVDCCVLAVAAAAAAAALVLPRTGRASERGEHVFLYPHRTAAGAMGLPPPRPAPRDPTDWLPAPSSPGKY